jgi:hypothetical protein
MTSSPPSAFVCQCKDEYRSACADLDCFDEYDGKSYCALHYPRRRNKSARFRQEFEQKVARGDFDFRGVWFPDDLDLRDRDLTFETRLDCSGAVFNGEVVFSRKLYRGGVDFSEAEFVKDVYFTEAIFVEEAIFNTTKFRALAYFRGATFNSSAIFEFATFGGEADFTNTTLWGEAYFGYTACASYLKFSAGDIVQGFNDQASLSLEFADVEQPERVSFNTLSLKSHWFVDVDPRKFDFANVTWVNEPIDKVLQLLQDKQPLSSPPVSSTPHRRLATAYRQLAINAEENNRYGEASDFRYLAMETRRREDERGYAFRTLDWWYWLASGYGERVRQAFAVLFGLWLAFAFLYMLVGFIRWEPKPSIEAEAMDVAKSKPDNVGRQLAVTEALTYSLGVLTLQKPEPRPATALAKLFVGVETVLGPVQAALLALAIRRKFMR